MLQKRDHAVGSSPGASILSLSSSAYIITAYRQRNDRLRRIHAEGGEASRHRTGRSSRDGYKHAAEAQFREWRLSTAPVHARARRPGLPRSRRRLDREDHDVAARRAKALTSGRVTIRPRTVRAIRNGRGSLQPFIRILRRTDRCIDCPVARDVRSPSAEFLSHEMGTKA